MRIPFSMSIVRVTSKFLQHAFGTCISVAFSICNELFLLLKSSINVIFEFLQKNRFLNLSLQYGSFHPKSDKLYKFSEITCSPVYPSTHPKPCHWDFCENKGARPLS